MDGRPQPAQAGALTAWLNTSNQNHQTATPPPVTVSTPGIVRHSQPVAQTEAGAGSRPQMQTAALKQTTPTASTQPQTTPRGGRVAVVINSSPNRRFPASELTPTTLPARRDLSEMAKRLKKNLGIMVPKHSTASQPQPGSTKSQPSSRSVKVTPVPIPIPPTRSSASTPQPQTTSVHRGRPKGWKPGVPYAVMGGPTSRRRMASAATKTAQRPRVARAKAPQAGFAKKQGRPPRAPSPLPHEIYHRLESRFIAFLCEWAGCNAELHNLDTLRRHVYVVHGKGDHHHGQGLDSQGYRICRWATCGEDDESAGYEKGHKRRTFRDEQHWRQHMDDAHLTPFGWHVGDGPQNSSAAGECQRGSSSTILEDDQLPDYLFDSDGNQVTPSIKDQEMEDFTTWRENRRKLKDLLERRDEKLQDETSESSDDGGL